MKPRVFFLLIAFLSCLAIAPSSYADNLATDAQLSLLYGSIQSPPLQPFPQPPDNPKQNSANSGSISSVVSYSPNNSPNYPMYSKAYADDTGKTATHVLGWGIGGAVGYENYASATYTTLDQAAGTYDVHFTIIGTTLGFLDSPPHCPQGGCQALETARYRITISDGSPQPLWSSGATYSYSYDANGDIKTSISLQMGTTLPGGAESHITNEQLGTLTIFGDWKYQYDNYNGAIMALTEAGTFNISTTIEVWAYYTGLERGAYASIGDPDSISRSNFTFNLTPSSPSSVPEPTTILLYGLGFAGAGLYRRMRRRK